MKLNKERETIKQYTKEINMRNDFSDILSMFPDPIKGS